MHAPPDPMSVLALLGVGLVCQAVWIGWLCWRYQRGHDPVRELREWWKGPPTPPDARHTVLDEDPEFHPRRR